MTIALYIFLALVLISLVVFIHSIHNAQELTQMCRSFMVIMTQVKTQAKITILWFTNVNKGIKSERGCEKLLSLP